MKRRKMLKDKDIPRWLSASLLTLFSCAIPVYIYLVNPGYLTSSDGYANGIETYTHTVEAIHTKNLIQSSISNFWFDSGSLGYPLFLTTQMFPNFLIALFMLVFESWVTPLCVFRWVIVILLTILPVAWYKAARNFRFSRIQSILLTVLTLSIDSQLQTGFELDAYFLHGHIPQLFGMLLMPLAASKIYLHGLCLDNQDQSKSVFFTCLVYLSHLKIGFLCSCISLVTTLLFIVAKEFNKRDVKESVKKFIYFHLLIFIYLSWWVIPLVISYPYNIEAYKTYQTFNFTSLVDVFTNGELFDYRQKYIWFTCLVVIGLCIAVKNLRGLSNFCTLQINQHQLFTTWLLLVTVLSMILFIDSSVTRLFQRVLPLDMNNDGSIYLVGLHFCGLLFASMSLSSIGDVLSYCVVRTSMKKFLNFAFVVLFTLFMIRHSALRVSERVTLVEVNADFVETLRSIKTIPKDGRLLTHEKFGSGGPWDMVNIPFLTGKPGVFLPGNKDTLSSFYLDKILMEYDDGLSRSEFINLLSLFNVQFLVASASTLGTNAFDLSLFRHIKTIYDIQFYQVDPENFNFGYFDIVRLPGYVSGNLKDVRPAVSETLTLFSKEVALFLNPSEDSEIRKKNIIFSHLERRETTPTPSLHRWNYNGEETDSLRAVEMLKAHYHRKWSSSIVIEQMHYEGEYHVMVQITNHEETPIDLVEHLLLKVSYHPFWRCTYFPIDNQYLLRNYDPNRKQENRTTASIHHVTPNVMAVTLPPGKYHVIFKYRFPGILKLMAVLLVLILTDNAFKCDWRKKVFHGMDMLYKLLVSAFVILVIKSKVYIWYVVGDGNIPFRKLSMMFTSSFNVIVRKYTTTVKAVKRKTSPKRLFNIVPLTKCMDFPSQVMQNDSECTIQSKDSKDSKEKLVGPCSEERVISNTLPHENTLNVDDDSPFFTPSTHVTKSSRKRMIRRNSSAVSQEKLIEDFIDDVLKCELRKVSSELFDIVHKSDSKCDIVEQPRLSFADDGISFADDGISFADDGISFADDGISFADDGISFADDDISKSHLSDGELSSKSTSISPMDDKMTTEDFYISDSYLYNSDISNDEILHNDNTQLLSENIFYNNPPNAKESDIIFIDTFKTTLDPEKEDMEEMEDDDELDLNKSLEICCFYDSPISSRSNSPLSNHDTREFSSSPDEHSSPDNSFEYRRDVEHVDESSQLRNEVAMSSDLYRIYMPDTSMMTPHGQRRNTGPFPVNDETRNSTRRSDTSES